MSTNLLITPIQPLIMLSGSAGVLLGLLGDLAGGDWLAQLTFWLTWLGLIWTVAVVQWTAALPGASLSIAGYGSVALVGTYAAIFALRWRTFFFGWLGHFVQLDLRDWQTRLVGPSAMVGVGVYALLLWSAAGALPDGRLHVYFLNIGQGDGILIQTPSGRQMLIDGGGSPELLFNELGAIMPFWDRTLDLVAVSNPDQDHMEAQAQAISRFAIAAALDTKAAQSNPSSDRWRAGLHNADATIQVQHRGGLIDLGDGVTLTVLWPPEELFHREKANDE